MRWEALLVGALIAGGAAHAYDEDALAFVSARYRDRAELQVIASRFQHVIVDERRKTASMRRYMARKKA